MNFNKVPFSNKIRNLFPKKDQKALSAPSLACLCKAGASSWSCTINPNRTRNLSLLLPWTVSARQASLPGQLAYPFTGPFCYSCFSVKLCSLVLLGQYIAHLVIIRIRMAWVIRTFSQANVKRIVLQRLWERFC